MKYSISRTRITAAETDVPYGSHSVIC